MGNADAAVTNRGNEVRITGSFSSPLGQALRPLTPLLAAAAFAVTAMTLVGSLLVA